MNAESMARALGGASKSTNGWWQCKCPAHEDDRASLGLHDADDGRVAWKCMASCDNKAVADALRAKGLLLEPARKAKAGKPKPKGKIVEVYDYVDEAGAILFQVVRYEPKAFSQRRPDPDRPGGWI
jgi:putative DNA primase/helicase